MRSYTDGNSKRSAASLVGGLIFIALIAAGISIAGNWATFVGPVQAREVSTPRSAGMQRQFQCSNATLDGGYAYIGHGFVPSGPPPAPKVPFGVVGIMTMDGAGNLSNKVTVNNDGQIMRNTDSGTYTINADCTGTITIPLPGPPFQLTWDLAVADLQGVRRGSEFYFIATTPGVVTLTAKRIQ